MSTYAANNASNSGTITNDVSFIAIAHNGGALKATTSSNAEKPSGIYSRFEREWQITNTNFTDDFSLEIEWLNAGSVTLSDLRLLVDSDGDFTNATVYSAADGLTFEFGSIIVRGIKTSMIPSGSTRFVTIASASSSTPLPVDLQSFNARIKENIVEINWKTTNEVNSDYFILEKSYDANKWQKIRQVIAAGNSNKLSNYLVYDDLNFTGICYYKLTQVDLDGKINSNNIVTVDNNEFKDLDNILIYPNPSNNNFTLEYFSEIEDDFSIIIESDNGQVLYNQHHQILKGANFIHLNTDIYVRGLYFVLIENTTGKLITRKIIKE